jgi:hypothetical protein
MLVNSPIIKRWFKRFLVATTILAVGSILGVLAITPPPVATQSAVVVTGNGDSLQRGIEANAARYTALAEYYSAEADNLQRTFDADTARYTALAKYYVTEDDDRQRGIDASAARYTALAKYYSVAKAYRKTR